MRIVLKTVTAAAITGMFFGVSAHAASAEDNSLRSITSRSLLPINNSRNDSLIEIDRSLNFSSGSGDTGSDVERTGEQPDENDHGR